MATDFFDRQDHARRQTTRLLVLFAMAVVGLIFSVYLAASLIIHYAHTDSLRAVARNNSHGYRPDSRREMYGERDAVGNAMVSPPLWRFDVFLWVAGGTSFVILFGSLYKMAELASGGEAVALMLGGRAISPQTQDIAERRLLNVVEEMALASGTPVPPVYVLDEERGINAFAAGHQPGDAVVAVSQGCLKYLTREELQGVVGHEFSHILNGDMRINLRLIGILNGILVLAIIGYYVLRSTHFAASGSSKKENGAAVVFMIGLALVILGYLGVFFGKVIKAAINRQREFLADASSVQFTRNPSGLAGALKKIGGLSVGSRIIDRHAEEVSHMFFCDAFAGFWLNPFATHPPLEKRITLLEPDFDGRFPEVRPLTNTSDEAAPSPKRSQKQKTHLGMPLPVLLPLDGSSPPIHSDNAARISGAIGMNVANEGESMDRLPEESTLPAGPRLIDVPPVLTQSVREPFSAQAVIYALLLSRDEDAARVKQMKSLQESISPPQFREVESMTALVQSIPETARLPLVDLAIPALKQCSVQQYTQFRTIVQTLVEADGKVDLFEYSLRIVLFTYLDVHFQLKKPPTNRYRTVNTVAQPATLMLSVLAYAGQNDVEGIQKAFSTGARSLSDSLSLTPKEECTLQNFDAALAQLAETVPMVKRRILIAASACVATDGKMTPKESELMRVISAVLGCPSPPSDAPPSDSSAS